MGTEPHIYRFSQVAEGIRVKETRLRNWLTRNRLDLGRARPEGGWRWFTDDDLLVLSVAAQLIELGAPVAAAVETVRSALAANRTATELYVTRCRNGPFDTTNPRVKGWRAETDEALLTGWNKGRPPLAIMKVHVAGSFAIARRRAMAAD